MKLELSNDITSFEGELDENEIFRRMIYEEMEAGQDEALYLCNLSDVARKYDIWRQKMPRVKAYYAVKCNSDENVVRLLAKLGTGFDCASRAEINAVLKHGVTPDRIIFANPCKAISHIRHAAATNTSLMTFDSTTELEKVHRIYPDADLVLRIRFNDMKARYQLGVKFGCDPKLEAPLLLVNAKNLGLSVVGISFHVGSGCQDPPIFRKAIAAAREVFNYASKIGYQMRLLDIGGGFPGDRGTDIDLIADVVNSALEDYFPPDQGVEIIAEPGRFFCSSAYTLAVTVHSKNERLGPDGNVADVKYFLNEGTYGSFNGVQYNPQRMIQLLARSADGGQEDNLEKVKCTIWGPSCDPIDKICDNLMLPLLDIGDVLVFPNMGAYTLPVATTFNGFPNPRVMYFAERKDWEIVQLIN